MRVTSATTIMKRCSAGMAATVALAAWFGPLATPSVATEGKPDRLGADITRGGPLDHDPQPYESKGRRDPFRPYVQRLDRPALTGQITPLQQYELSQLRLVAIITDEHNAGGTRAVVEDNAGLGYIIRVGTPIGRTQGQVTAIERDHVVIEETPMNVFGEQHRTVIVKELDAGEEAKR
jgi:hypothetical protein